MDTLFTVSDQEKISTLVLALMERKGFSSASKFAQSIGFGPADISNLKGEKWKQNPSLIGPEKWIRLARIAGFNNNETQAWNTAHTRMYKHIFTHLTLCKSQSQYRMLIDEAGFGKTYAAKEFAQNHPNTFYIDCSDYSNKNRLIRAIATTVGTSTAGTYDDMLADTLFALGKMNKPLLIFDEAGEICKNADAIMILKRIYNHLEHICGMYLIGSNGLKKVMLNRKRRDIQGYHEVFDRFEAEFRKCIPEPNLKEDRVMYVKEMAKSIMEANGVSDSRIIRSIQNEMVENGKSLRFVYNKIIGLRLQASFTANN
ncbi:MAG: ATP-binding protein [Pedobacter sp.]|jgi:hypothetical protein|nr:MAG: ATP-binding protein [Pedobacter sp.]